MSTAFRLTLLRHGATLAPGGLGQHDAALSPLGHSQLEARWAALNGTDPIRAVASSDLQRCRDFAEIAASRDTLPCRIDAGFRELDCGRLNGVRADALVDGDALSYRRWQHDPADGLAGGESWAVFTARIDAALQRWLVAGADGHHLLLTHGGVIKALLLHWFGLPPNRHGQFWPGHAGHVSVWWDAAYPPVLLAFDAEPPR
ncbi:hypothetical protein JHS3_23870 [Jeongeupia sp. HS-3]|uniref:histidine phosphatase family protein n=1 Tax=Jeongeupia sp. HS-3 TaxID=1009682 RepID=UPI0018A4C8FF|nr:histidine phosphatase family protein [Jeongeupia sp. HS-3]BCL76651.1 hypothetical protein JHS3_23870 [Jeongeupia sp. HS-3]